MVKKAVYISNSDWRGQFQGSLVSTCQMYQHFNNDKLEKVIKTSSDKIDAQYTSVHQKSSSLKSWEGDPPNSLENIVGKVIHHFHVDYYVKKVIHTQLHILCGSPSLKQLKRSFLHYRMHHRIRCCEFVF